jgi:subtilase family serine protease
MNVLAELPVEAVTHPGYRISPFHPLKSLTETCLFSHLACILCWDKLNPYIQSLSRAQSPPHGDKFQYKFGRVVMARTSVLSFRRCVAMALLMTVAVAAPAQTRNRIMQSMETGERAVVGGVHPMARAEFDRGPVAGSMRIDHAALVFKPSAEQQRALEKLLAEQQDPTSPNYHKWLTPEQYGERFGMSETDLAKVSSWLKSQGLTVEGYARGRNRIFFSGTAAQVASAFRTEFHQYAVDGETRFANVSGITVPAALSGVVMDFRGFDSFRPRPRVRTVKPDFTSHLSGLHLVAPGDFAVIYNVKALYDSGFDGTGQSIAVVGQTTINTADIDAFRSAAGLPAKNLQLVSVDNTTGISAGDEVEADLDVEWSGGVAKNATVLYVFVGSKSSKHVFDALNFAVDNKLSPVISVSYGNCEATFSTLAGELAFRQTVQQANSQGQTIIAPSGDTGAADCDFSPTTPVESATKGLAVDMPASVPEVTALGGTEFMGDSPNPTTSGLTDAPADPPFWAGTTNSTDTITSALTYIPEMAWNDTAASVAASQGFSATGGGVSTVFAKPTWQVPVTPADGHRDVPDISLNASPNHDGSLICSQGSCVNGFRDSSGNVNNSIVGGTSVSVPAFAGIVAIINQAVPPPAGQLGQGNINPTLYSQAGTSAFHDITVGDNKVPCTSGTPTTGPASARCPTTAPFVIGFSAGPGYDLVTGLGSINAHTLVTSWPGFVATADFSVGATPVSIASAGQGGTSTVTVTATNGFNGTVNLACALTPASTTVGVTCSIPPSVAVNGSSETATLTISTVAPHVVSGTSVSMQRPAGFGWVGASGSVLLVGVFLLGLPLRRRRRVVGLGVTLLVFFVAGMGCGGGSSSGGTKTGGTPAGSYTISVTATSTSPALSHTANVAVTVQ